MKKLYLILALLFLTACGTDRGLTTLEQYSGDVKSVVILEDEATRDSVLPVIEQWFRDNRYEYRVVQSMSNVGQDEYVLTYSAKWSWDMATYMRRADFKLTQRGAPMATLSFDAVNYGGMGKFGSAEKRITILLDVLFGKITRAEGDKRLGDA